jgi:hypothetical protein
MPHRLAIAISGAVSLGSYEAGVMYEILRAIAQHNQAVGENSQERVVIDVITGASAGAMTACILAQKLMFEADQLEDSDSRKNVLYQAWVEDVDIQKLLNLRPSEDPNLSLLSSDLIAEIGYEHLLARYQNSALDQETLPKIHPAAAEVLYLGVAMSNLNGVDYGVDTTDISDLSRDTLNSFIYTAYQDRYICRISAGENSGNPQVGVKSTLRQIDSVSNTLEDWTRVEAHSLSSGAFPFAFRPIDLVRNRREYGAPAQNYFQSEEQRFTYTDGGVFENEPLGMAKEIVDSIDNHLNEDTRFYLYVAPSPRGSSRLNNFQALNADFIKMAEVLGKAIFNQARFRDWITSSSFSKLIQRFNQQSESLRWVILNASSAEQQAIATTTELFLRVLYKEGAEREKDFERLRRQLQSEYTVIENQGHQDLANLWLQTVQILEIAADLSGRDKMKVFTILARPEELIGEGLSSFVGFLKQEFRVFDYDVGRQRAIDFLNKLKQAHTPSRDKNYLPLTGFQSSPYPALDPQLEQVARDQDETLALSLVPEEIRQELKQALLNRVTNTISLLFSSDKQRWFPLRWFWCLTVKYPTLIAKR